MATKAIVTGHLIGVSCLMISVVFLVLRWSGLVGWDYVWLLSPLWILSLVGGLLQALLLVVAGFVKVAEEG